MSAAAPFVLLAMVAAWEHAVTLIAKWETAAVCVRELRIEFEALIAARVVARSTGTNTLTSRPYAILAAATVSSSADRAGAAQRRSDV